MNECILVFSFVIDFTIFIIELIENFTRNNNIIIIVTLFKLRT